MGTWKFLVQRDGKQSWTALEGEVMSLEPGRYRIAARAPVTNTPVAIEIAVIQPTGEQRNYRRSTRTNGDGLLAVIPFTDLSDGDWMLTCQTMGNHVAPETASISWRVIEPMPMPMPIAVADPWAEPEDVAKDMTAAVEAVEVAKAVEAVETVETVEAVEMLEAVEEIGGEDPADRVDDEVSQESGAEVSVEGEETVGVIVDVTDDGAIAAISEESSDRDQPVSDPNPPGGESADLDAICNETELEAIETAISDVTGGDITGETVAEPIVETVGILETVESADQADQSDSTEVIMTPQIALPEVALSDATIEEESETVIETVIDDVNANSTAIATNVIVMPGISDSLPAVWMEHPDSTHPENVTEHIESESSSAHEIEPEIQPEIQPEISPEIQSDIASELLPDATVPDLETDPAPPTLTTYTDGQLRLQLDRTSFTVVAGGILSLSGRIQADASIDPQSRLAGLHLRLRLREPQSLRILTVRQFLLPPTAGGIILFERSVPLPDSTTSKLILGELLLCDTVPNTIDQQAFTITAGLESLLSNLTDRNRAPEPVVWQKQQWSDADSQINQPPKTTPPLIPKPPKPTLDLPGFVASPGSGIDKSQLLASLGLAPEMPHPEDADRTDDLIDSVRDRLDIRSEAEIEAATSATEATELADSTAAFEASRRAATHANRPPLEPLTPPSHRNDRFVSRLNQIAHDDELTSWLTESDLDLDLGAEGLPDDLASGDLAPLTGASHVLTQESIESDREAAREIVLDRPGEAPRRPSFSRSTEAAPKVRPVLPADTSIPSPDLSVPPGQLTAGRSILVRARLPELSSRIYIKLWIYDRQNQALLDGPRWLTDFLPIGDGNVEGMINLTVPYGGLDVQFEAIAVEVETDRESYKTVVERRIVPSAPPSLPLENRSMQR
jgi:hypothetical protein